MVLDEGALHVGAERLRGRRHRPRRTRRSSACAPARTSSSARVSARSGRDGSCAPAAPTWSPASTCARCSWPSFAGARLLDDISTSRTRSRSACWAPSSTWCPSRASTWSRTEYTRVPGRERHRRATASSRPTARALRRLGRRDRRRRWTAPTCAASEYGDAPGRELHDRRHEPRARAALLRAHARTRSSSSAATGPRSSSPPWTRPRSPWCSPATTCPAPPCSSAPRSAACRSSRSRPTRSPAADGMRRLFGRLRVNDRAKIELIAQLIDESRRPRPPGEPTCRHERRRAPTPTRRPTGDRRLERRRDDRVVRVAVDAAGGDNAPAEVVARARSHAAGPQLHVVLVGDEPRIRALVPAGVQHVSVVHAPDVIGSATSRPRRRATRPARQHRRRASSSCTTARPTPS